MGKELTLYAVLDGTLEASWPDEAECVFPNIAARENSSRSVTTPIPTSANMVIGSNKPCYERFETTVNDVSSPAYLAGIDAVDVYRSARGSSVVPIGGTRNRPEHSFVKLLGASKANTILGEEPGTIEQKSLFSFVGFPRRGRSSLLDVSETAVAGTSPALTRKKAPSDLGGVSAEHGATPLTSPWCVEKDVRRCELIDKKIQGTLKTAEAQELAELQLQALEYFDRIAPPPVEGARRLHSRLIEKASQQPDT